MMKIKATVYDTTNGKQREIVVRNIYCDKGGKPMRIGSQNGMQYREFKLKIN